MHIDRIRYPFQINGANEQIPLAHALSLVEQAMKKWESQTEAESRKNFNTLAESHPDCHAPEDFWHSASSKAFRDFFVWGHNHNFGHGFTRAGAMEIGRAHV